MTHRVFISYSTKETEQANAVCVALESVGIGCWIAPRDISHGETWAGAIINAINSCESVVLLFSENSNASEDVRREINRACSRNRRILTVRLDNTLPTGDLEFFLSRTQWLDAHEGPLDSHLETLLLALQSPSAAQGLHATPMADVSDETAIETALREIDWRIAELEHFDGPLRCSPIDNVLEPTLQLTEQMHAAQQWEPCLKIYLAAARGVVRILDSACSDATVAWPVEIEYLQQKLRSTLDEITAENHDAANAVERLHPLFADFLDRVPPHVQSGDAIHRVTLFSILGCLALSGLSLILAYLPKHTTATWELRYAYAYGPNFPRIGGYLEFSRSLVLAIVVTYLFEILFRSEFERLLLDWSWRSWRRPWVAFARCFGLCVVTYATWTVIGHALVDSPTREAVWATDHLKKLKDDSSLPAGTIRRLQAESQPDFADHARPYYWYLPYCLVNYGVYGALLLSLCLYAILSDGRRLVEERDGLNRILINQRLPDADLEREFLRFFHVCFRHTQRYITLLLWLAVIIVYESVITRATLSLQGWRYEILTSAVVGLSALVWVGILIHFYEGAFQRCCDEKRRRRRLTEHWERAWNTTRFLTKCFLNLRFGVAVGIYLAPVALMVFEVARR